MNAAGPVINGGAEKSSSAGSITAAVFAFLMFLYISIYPPFFLSCFVDPVIRLAVETFILLILVFYAQYENRFRVSKNIIWLVVFVLLYGMFSLEGSKQVLSFFNKYVFFILLLKIMHDHQVLTLLLKRLWVFAWIIFSISAVIACAGYALDLIPYSTFDFSNYTYQYNSLVGLVLPKHTGTFVFPRYTGWFIEPGPAAFFFGVNVLVAGDLLADAKWAGYFKRLNILAGLLTFSVTFYAFFFVYYLYKVLSRKLPKSIIWALGSMGLLLLVFILLHPDYASYTSLADRTWRFEKVWTIFVSMDIEQMLFGLGIIPLQTAIGGGSASGLIDILLGRGLLIFCFIALLCYRYTKHNLALLLFIIYYNLSFSFFTYPLFLFVVALAYESHFLHKSLADLTPQFLPG